MTRPWADLWRALPADIKQLLLLLVDRPLDPTTRFAASVRTTSFEFAGYTVAIAAAVTGPGGHPVDQLGQDWSIRTRTRPSLEAILDQLHLLRSLQTIAFLGTTEDKQNARMVERDVDELLTLHGRPPEHLIALDQVDKPADVHAS